MGLSGILVNSLVLYLATAQLKIFYLLSVVVATVGSTLWNFSLTEALVYRSKDQSRGRVRRLLLFSVMNTLALGLRGPVIFVMTSLIGIKLFDLEPGLAHFIDRSTVHPGRQLNLGARTESEPGIESRC